MTGWTAEKQRAFVEALADTGSVTEAARSVGMSVQSCYQLRRAPGAENLAAAWDGALRQGALKLADMMMERAMNGVDEPVFDREGRRIGARIKYNDRLGMPPWRVREPQPLEPSPAQEAEINRRLDEIRRANETSWERQERERRESGYYDDDR